MVKIKYRPIIVMGARAFIRDPRRRRYRLSHGVYTQYKYTLLLLLYTACVRYYCFFFLILFFAYTQTAAAMFQYYFRPIIRKIRNGLRTIRILLANNNKIYIMAEIKK